jgi:beta-phosphoglucomutase-like phosphatase (HAD superfamily)
MVLISVTGRVDPTAIVRPEPATFWLAAKRLNQLRHREPLTPRKFQHLYKRSS